MISLAKTEIWELSLAMKINAVKTVIKDLLSNSELSL